MSNLLELKTFSDKRGNLSVVEDYEIPFPIKRLFYIYGVDNSVRGGHRHKKTWQALICLKGSCKVYVNNDKDEKNYLLDHPKKCLIIAPEDWHKLYEFSAGAILLVCASEYFDENDYIFEEYKKQEVRSKK
jgi:dTDP-4-dehydrorhamnose 3,5-epimerase-like enzyme